MADQLIASVIPPGTGPARRWPGRPGTAAGLPLASPPGIPRVPAGVVYGLGRIDASGRIADRAITRALGWQGGDRLTLVAAAGVVIARRDPAGMVTLPASPALPRGQLRSIFSGQTGNETSRGVPPTKGRHRREGMRRVRKAAGGMDLKP